MFALATSGTNEAISEHISNQLKKWTEVWQQREQKKRRRRAAIDDDADFDEDDGIEVPWLKKSKPDSGGGVVVPVSVDDVSVCKEKVPSSRKYTGLCRQIELLEPQSEEMEQYLLKRVRDYICETDKLKRNVLHLSAYFNSAPVVRLFLCTGYDESGKGGGPPKQTRFLSVTSVAQGGMQALHFAVQANKKENTFELIKYGASLNAKTFKGLTCAHIASKNGHIELLEDLIRAGAHVTALTNSKQTIVGVAREGSEAQVEECVRSCHPQIGVGESAATEEGQQQQEAATATEALSACPDVESSLKSISEMNQQC